jgi:hypothetical protein
MASMISSRGTTVHGYKLLDSLAGASVEAWIGEVLEDGAGYAFPHKPERAHLWKP